MLQIDACDSCRNSLMLSFIILGTGIVQSSRHYFLKSPRLGFRLWSMDDLSLALTLWGDSQVSRFLGGPFSPEQIRARLTREIEIQRDHRIQYWPVFLLTNGEFAGCCGLRPYKEQVPELGFHFLPSHWGKGIASEAGRAVISYAFDPFGAKALFAGHHPDNAASARVLEKLGFRYTHHEIYPPTGEMHPSYLLERPH
jgi:[ribosomal protein S5]-alanine N-acetyltransferase